MSPSTGTLWGEARTSGKVCANVHTYAQCHMATGHTHTLHNHSHTYIDTLVPCPDTDTYMQCGTHTPTCCIHRHTRVPPHRQLRGQNTDPHTNGHRETWNASGCRRGALPQPQPHRDTCEHTELHNTHFPCTESPTQTGPSA